MVIFRLFCVRKQIMSKRRYLHSTFLKKSEMLSYMQTTGQKKVRQMFDLQCNGTYGKGTSLTTELFQMYFCWSIRLKTCRKDQHCPARNCYDRLALYLCRLNSMKESCFNHFSSTKPNLLSLIVFVNWRFSLKYIQVFFQLNVSYLRDISYLLLIKTQFNSFWT